MRHVSHSSFCAVAAVAATLALGSTPAAAQDAEAPTIVLPPAVTAPVTPPAATTPAVPPASQTPTIVLPPEVTEAAQSPASAPAEDAATSAAAPAAAATTTQAERAPAPVEKKPSTAKADKPAPARNASQSPSAAPAPETQGTAGNASLAGNDLAGSDLADSDLADSDLSVPPPVAVPQAAQPAAPVAEAPQPDSVRRPIDVPDEAIAGGALAVLGLGIAGFVATRRRRKDEVLDDDIYEAENQYVEEEPVTSIPSELETRSEPVAPSAPVDPSPVSAAALAGGPVPTGEARQRLLDEMVAAAPDNANPFTSRPARRKRARIILQAREHRQRQQTGEPFDWRTYQPSATLDPATPPLVDA